MNNLDQWEQVQVGGVNCIHLSAIIINIPVITYWDQMKQTEAPVCIKIYMQDWFLSDKYFSFLSSSEGRYIFRRFYDQHNDWGIIINTEVNIDEVLELENQQQDFQAVCLVCSINHRIT